ncbi:hypothetical protein C8R43DRAFT_890492, partial [Mycena crocata]
HDPSLTDDEIDLICGVYHVGTGSCLTTTDQSWWPEPSTWARSAMNVGWWSPYCERWFPATQLPVESSKFLIVQNENCIT